MFLKIKDKPQTKRFSRRAKWTTRTGMALTLLAALLMCAGLYACNSSSDSDDSPAAETVNLKATFTDAMESITPNLATAGVSEWSGWQGETNYSVLHKLFHPDSGWESVFGPVEIAEDALDIIELNAALLEEDGSHEITFSDGNETMAFTMNVSNLEKGIFVPYFDVTESNVTRQVVIESDDGNWKTMVAYHMEGDEKAMVVHSKNSWGEAAEYMVFRANFNEISQDLQIWAAMADDSDDAFKIHYEWKGNMETKTFALTQHTNSAWKVAGTDGMWKVMGGGSIDDQMAFRANTNDAPNDDYFVVVTLDSMIAQEAPEGMPAVSTSIDSAAVPVQKYIDTAHADCLGWLSGFPQVTEIDNLNY